MAITTLKGHVSRALDFYNKDKIHFGIGKTTAWDTETNPPVPQSTDELVGPVAYKKVETKHLVVQDDNGELEYRDKKWKIVTPSEAYEKGARWVYLRTDLLYTELTVDIAYRQIGVLTGVTAKSTVPSGQALLLPADVDDAGILEVLDNRKPVYREADQNETLVVIVEF